MPQCAAYGCTNSDGKDRNRGITFHKFPVNVELKVQWIKAIHRSNYEPSPRAVVCSKHFHEEDFDRYSHSCVRLRSGVVPTVFPAFPTYLQTLQKDREPPSIHRLPVKPLSEESVSSVTFCNLKTVIREHNDCLQANTNTHSVSSDPDLSPRNEALKRKLDKANRRLSASRKKIKLLLQTQRRLLKKNASLTNIISDLKKRALVS